MVIRGGMINQFVDGFGDLLNAWRFSGIDSELSL